MEWVGVSNILGRFLRLESLPSPEDDGRDMEKTEGSRSELWGCWNLVGQL